MKNKKVWIIISIPFIVIILIGGGILYLNSTFTPPVSTHYIFPVQINSIGAGDGFSMAITDDGTLWTWGVHRALERSRIRTSGIPHPTNIMDNAAYVAGSNTIIPFGSYQSAAITTDGDLWILGVYRVGYNAYRTFSTPTRIMRNAVAVSTGASHMMTITSDGTLWGWGNNRRGQLGDGTTINRDMPVQIGTSTDWISVTAQDLHTIALKNDGSLWAWGVNHRGQFGDNRTIGYEYAILSPVSININTTWISVDTSSFHTVALCDNGSIWAWGSNLSGELGNSTTTNSGTPVQVGNSTDWVSVAAGNGFTIAQKTDGSLWSWGTNQLGELGNGEGGFHRENSVLSPKQIGTDTDWASIAVGAHRTIATKLDGSLWTWGWEGRGEGIVIGDSAYGGNRYSPIKIMADFDCRKE